MAIFSLSVAELGEAIFPTVSHHLMRPHIQREEAAAAFSHSVEGAFPNAYPTIKAKLKLLTHKTVRPLVLA